MKRFFNLILITLLLVLTACNKPKTITVTFETNGGEEIEDVTFEDFEDFIIPEDPTKEGYNFECWFIDSNFNTMFDINIPIEDDLTLYAKWLANQYEISFETNGGSEIKNTTAPHDGILARPEDPKKEDYILEGWYIDRNFTNKYDFSKKVIGSFTLYAKWNVPLVDEVEYNAFYIVTSPGEDASTMININYQINNIHSNVEYTLASDEDFKNKEIVTPIITGFEALSTKLEVPFSRRNICKLTIANLKPNTEYKYRINQGNGTYSEDYFFKTSGGDDTTSFLFMTDVHYYDGFDGAEISEEVINSALTIQPDLDFLFTTGDMVDTGGNADDWDKLFTNGESLKKLPYLGVPGNHEHYEIADTKNEIFRSYFNFPQNGIGEYRGASYYYIHNETLFIQLDTSSSYNVGAQLEWLEEVIENNPTKFIIVGTHAPFFDKSTIDYKKFYLEIMDKYAVDLVLAGHYHSDRFEILYNDENPYNDHLGVAYQNGAGGGIKSIGDNDPMKFAKGYIIDILDDRINIRYMNAFGEILANREVINKKLAPKEEATKVELISSINYIEDHDNETITFNWSRKFYKNVKSMRIIEDYRDQREITYVFPTPGYTKYQFDKFTSKYDHAYTFEIEFADGTEEIKKYSFPLSGGNNLEVKQLSSDSVTITYDEPIGTIASIISKYEIYLNDELVLTYKGKDANNNFEQVTSATLEDLESNTTYNLVLKAYSMYGFIYSDEVNFTTK